MNSPYRSGPPQPEELLTSTIQAHERDPTCIQQLTRMQAAVAERLARGGRVKHLAQTAFNDLLIVTVVIEYPL